MAKEPGVKDRAGAKKAAEGTKTDLSTRIAAGAKAVQGTRVVPDLSGDRKELERKNIAILQSPDATAFEKDLACRQLAVIGTKAAVPALAELAVSDEHLCDVACWGLERIPDPAADEALRAALKRVKGRQLQKVIQTIANRRDTGAVGDLAKLLGDSDIQVASAAARALGKIGGPLATKALTDALSNAPDAIRPAVGDGCVTLADTLLAEGNAKEAAAVFDQARKANLPAHIRAAATRGAILARKTDGVALLLEELESGDRKRFNIAVRAIYELPDDAVRALESKLGASPKATPKPVLLALKNRKQE